MRRWAAIVWRRGHRHCLDQSRQLSYHAIGFSLKPSLRPAAIRTHNSDRCRPAGQIPISVSLRDICLSAGCFSSQKTQHEQPGRFAMEPQPDARLHRIELLGAPGDRSEPPRVIGFMFNP